MSTAYNLRMPQILSLQAATITKRQKHRFDTKTISDRGWKALSTPTMNEAHRLKPTLAIPFNLYKCYWLCYLQHCEKCIDAEGRVFALQERSAVLADRLERGLPCGPLLADTNSV